MHATCVYIIAGQSNAFGRKNPALLTDQTLAEPFPRVQMAEELECPSDDGLGACSVHSPWTDLDVHTDDGTFGPVPTYGRTLYANGCGARTRVICVGTSGASFEADWDRGLTSGRVLYSRMLSYISARTDEIPGPWRICGFSWVHGEADANTFPEAAAYETKLRAFRDAVREDLDEPELPFVCVRLSANSGKNATRLAQIRAAQVLIGTEAFGGWVNVDDLTMDGVHYFPDGYVQIGKRLADEILRIYLDRYFGKRANFRHARRIRHKERASIHKPRPVRF